MNLVATGQTTEIYGTISNDTIWSSDTVMVIGDVTVAEGVRLTIDPGVIVQLQNYYKISVNGSLFAIGTEADSITFTIADTTGFYANINSLDGGWSGIYIIGEDGSTDTTIFNYCRMEYGKNYDTIGGDVKGGVLFIYNYGALVIENCFITNNSNTCEYSGAYGGAIYGEKVNSIFINSNWFTRNVSSYEGGAIRIDHDCVSVEISNNRFIKNTGRIGAAVSSSDLVYGHVIANNYCFNNYNASNGVIYTSNPYGWVYNNVICNNDGIGIVDGHQLSATKIFGNTIVNNIVPHYGGGIMLHSKANVYNNICWGNIDEFGNIPSQICIESLGDPILSFNCVEYGNGGEHAVYDYPKFVDPSYGAGTQYEGELADWSLLNESTCVNTGTIDTTSLNIPAYDILGNDRVFGNRIDIGAIENQEVYVSIYNIVLDKILQIYPNPGNDRISITHNYIDDELLIELFDVQAKKVLSTSINPSGSIDISLLPAGIYFYTIYIKNVIQSKGKWIKN
jgi:hypothetical protein